MKRYDVFISYRRDSYESANLIATRLKSAGYSVFFDLETMRPGKFNVQLYSVIEGCQDFVLVLPENALDRCSDDEDWVRKEVLHAMKHKKNIIPVMLNGFVWPKPMPEGMEELCNYQALKAGAIEYFDMSMERLASYLKSTKRTKLRAFSKWAIIAVITIAVLLVSSFFILRSVAKPLCLEFAEQMTYDVMVAEFLIEDNKDLKSAMTLEEDALVNMQIEIVKRNIEGLKKETLEPLHFSSWQKFLLSLYGIKGAHLTIVNKQAEGMYMYLDGTIGYMQELVKKRYLLPTEAKLLNSRFGDLQHLGNVLYYYYLQILSKMPESLLGEINELRSRLVNMPNVALGADESEYDILIEQELAKMGSDIPELHKQVEQLDDELYKLQKMSDSLDVLIREAERQMQ